MTFRSLPSLLLALLLPSTSLGCGGFFCEPARPVVQSGEAIAFGVKGDTVTMHVQILYEGPAEGFSWILPMPVEPDEIRVGSDLLFSSLFRQTLPQWQLEVIEEANDSCSEADLEADQCIARDSVSAEMMDESAEDGATVLEEGSVGPFDFVVLEAAENNPSSVLDWLNENGYDQPEGSAPLLNYYAVNNHVFVALRLQKEAETGEIQPLILQYTMPEAADATAVSRRAMACVPIQLTSIAATEAMPIQVYILGQARAVPLNFVELELDDTQVDWLNCQNNPGCFDDNYRVRFDRAANQLVNHSFVTEFAGASQELLRSSIEVSVTQEEIASATSMDDFFQTVRFRLPPLTLVDTIVREQTMDSSSFDASALALELEEKVLKPARDAQAFVDGFPYLTRMYARLSPSSMTKDSFFAFKPELPDVDNVHVATAVPICADGSPSGLTITTKGGTIVVPATRECGSWSPSQPFIWNASQSPAILLASWGFEGDEGMVVSRSLDGTFDGGAVAAAISFGDSLVMDQTIPEYVATDGNTGGTENPSTPSSESSDTSPDSGDSACSLTLLGAYVLVVAALALL